MILLRVFVILAVDAVVGSASVAYRTISKTVSGEECLSDCIGGSCVVDRSLKTKSCVTDGLPAPRFRTSVYRGKEEYCLSNCHNFGYDYFWCFTSESYSWDYCSPSGSRKHSSDYKGKKCTTPCVKINKDSYYSCDSPSGSKTYCAPSAIANSTDCGALLFSKNVTIYSNRIKRQSGDSIYGFDEHRLVAPAWDNLVEDSAALLERQYGVVNAGPVIDGRNNPVISYTTRPSSVPDRGRVVPVTLPLVVRATITSTTISHTARPASNVVVPPDVKRNVDLMKSSVPNRAFDAGHLIGYQNGGPSSVFNFAPQTRTLNRGPFLRTENYINQWCRYGGSVDMTVVVFYTAANLVPESFGVKLTFYEPLNGRVHADCMDTVYLNN